MTDSKAFRQCLGKFATGVTVVTCTDGDGHPRGITANSFSSVSLEPPLVLWSIAKESRSLDTYLNADHFAINVLSSQQQVASLQFTKSDDTPFRDIEYTLSDGGAPLLADTLATFECRTHQVHDCGDHFIIIGAVSGFRSDERNPLLFYNGAYRSIED